MTVYVDDKEIPLGRMKMCHVAADTREELQEMMKKLGIKLEYIQQEGTWREHFDISQMKRAKAIKLGAVEVTSKELIKILRDK